VCMTNLSRHSTARNVRQVCMRLIRMRLSVSKEKKRKENFTLFSDHDGSLQRRQPGALSVLISSMHNSPHILETAHLDGA